MTDAATPKASYHHGDLRAALLAAAEAELAERGNEGFSLRRVALRAGVSHAAPAHHFGDVGGLLTALAAAGYRRFVEAQRARMRSAPDDPREQLIASGLGYVDFALACPAILRLMFASDRPDYANPDLKEAADAAYSQLAGLVRATGGGMRDEAAAWAVSHGLADLMASGRLRKLGAMDPATRDAAVRDIIGRVMP